MRRALVGVAAVTVSLAAAHGLVHLASPVHVHGWQYAAGTLTSVLLPAAGAFLLVRGRPVAGGWLLLLAGLAALTFEAVFHFVVANPDHVATVERHRALFAGTAALSTAADAALATAAGWHLRRRDA